MHWRRTLSRPFMTITMVMVVLLSGAGFLFFHQNIKVAHADNGDPAHYDNIPNYTISGFGNTYINNGPNGYVHVQSAIDQAVVTADGCVHTKSVWDEGGNSWGVYCNGTVEMHDSSNAPSPVDNTNVTINGDTWSINNGGVQDSNGTQISGIGKATALGIDIPHNQLMVADDGAGQHVIKFYDVSGSPNLVRTFGTVGGIRAGNPGEVTPTKFWGLTGVGTDSDGNIYVTGSQNGVFIRSFTPDGSTVRWEMYGLHFTDSCDFDRASDGQWIYCDHKVYQMDYSKPVGQQWTLKYWTMDLDTYPNDVRDSQGNSAYLPLFTWYRQIGGRQYLFITDMSNTTGFNIFKFEGGNSHIAAPSGHVTGDDMGGYEGSYHVAFNGDLYKAGCDKIDVKRLQSISDNGDLNYGPLTTIDAPAPFNCVEKMYYDDANDVMYLGGGTPDQPTQGWGNAGPVMAKYTNWSSNPQLAWQVNVPFYHNDDPNVDNRHVPVSYAVANNYLFVSYANRDNNYATLDGESGATRVYRVSDGSYVGRMIPDGPGGVQGSWIDAASAGTEAIQRSDGTYLLIREEDWLNKIIMYMWNPDGPPSGSTPVPTPTTPPTATPTPPATPTATSTPTSGSLVLAINAGGSADGSFVADTDYDQGNQYSDTSSSVDTSGVSNPAPQGVYQTCRWNSSFTYTIPNLTAGASYKIRLHWADLSFDTAGQRQFNVAINGSQVLNNFDVAATAGTSKKAVVKEFTAQADNNGNIVIAFTQGSADNPFISGIEIYTA